jgi:hypothetical protein
MRFSRFVTLAVSLCFSAAAFANDAAVLFGKYSKLSIGSSSPVSNLTLISGRLKLTLARGNAAPVKAGDETVGLFFKGDGTYEYKLDDAVELPVAKFNLRSMKTDAKFAGSDTSGTITGSFQEVLWAAPGATLPALTGSGADLSTAFSEHRSEHMANEESQLSHLLALHKLNAPAAKPVRAELRGSDSWVYEYDDFHARDEQLYKLFTWAFDDRSRRSERYQATISTIPIGRTRRDMPFVPAIVTAIDYTMIASTDRDMMLSIKETIVPKTNARAVALNLFDEVYVDNKAARHLRVKKLTGADGAALAYVHDTGRIIITLPAGSAANKPVDINFEIEGDILSRPSGDNYWLLRGPWYPQAELEAENATVHGIVKVKAPYVAFNGGQTVARRTEGDYNVVESKLDSPVGFLCVVAGKYFSHDETRDGFTIKTSSYGVKNTASVKKITDLAFNMVKYYEYFLGPFPFKELSIVEINSFGWGQAPAGLVFITSEAFQPVMGEVNQIFSEGINERLAHEIAHQYWGWGVKMPGLDEQWLTESFAEYSAALLLKKFQGDAVYNRMVGHWRGNASQALGAAPIPLAYRMIKTADWDWERIYLLYNKGPVLLTALHKQLGDEKFLTFLKSYQKTFRGKFGTTKDVEGLLGFMTKQDFKPFFDQYYWGVGSMPETK